VATQRGEWVRTHGEGLRIHTGTITSPTLARQIKALRQSYPAMRWHQWEPVSRDAVRAGQKLAYGRAVKILPHLDAANVIIVLDSDLISSAPGHYGSRAISRPGATRRARA
jgi:molybdopterin-containing oxidoreductase family iron-sulfur binding subunit